METNLEVLQKCWDLMIETVIIRRREQIDNGACLSDLKIGDPIRQDLGLVTALGIEVKCELVLTDRETK